MKNKKIGLALGGGAVLGAAHVGVLKALEEYNIEISYIAGTSAGALVGAFYASGMSISEMEDIAKRIQWSDVSGIMFNRYSILSNNKLGDLIIKHLGNKTLEQTQIPLELVATDISTGKKVNIKKGSLSDGVKASTCIPGLFKPVIINKRMLVDGGIVENVPINTVRAMGADYVIAVDLNGKYSNENPKNIIGVLMNSFHFTLKEAVKMQFSNADLLLQPDLSRYGYTELSKIMKILERGYKDTIEVLSQLEIEKKSA
jgi:NTE family protein